MIAVVVPTLESRAEIFKKFEKAWEPLFKKHNVTFIVIYDSDCPYGTYYNYANDEDDTILWNNPLIYTKNDGVRNAGFLAIAKEFHEIEVIITLDDDVLPLGDPIQDHLDALASRVPISWMSTASEYMRGFPYGIRDEAEVVLSHGVWQGVKDWDAPTQLVMGNRDVTFYKGPIPKGVFYPMCGMNIAFKRKMLPYMYFAPMGYKVGLDRFADIWLGIESKRVIDKKGWAVVSGYATVRHERASNVWKNLQKEARGLELNEGFWKGDATDPYFKEYKGKRLAWQKLISSLLRPLKVSPD